MTSNISRSSSEANVQYTIDRGDIITSTGGSFEHFSEQNDTPNLHLKILGKPIWQFLSTDEMNEAYKDLFDAVRGSQKPLTITFRCDSSDTLRFMTMQIKPEKDDSLQITTSTVRAIPRARVLASEILYRGVKDGVPMCSHCNKVFIENLGTWLEIDGALANGHIDDNLSVSFTLCENCKASFRRTIEEAKRD